MSRRLWVRTALLGIFGLLGTFFTAGAVKATARDQEGYGRCSRCSCPRFYGSGYTCSRGGCSHHYDSHW